MNLFLTTLWGAGDAVAMNPLMPAWYESFGLLLLGALAVWATVAVLGSRQRLSVANMAGLILASWFVPVIGPLCALFTAYERPKTTQPTPASAGQTSTTRAPAES